LNRKAELSITRFGATSYKKYGWATENELPLLENVESVIAFLDEEGDIGLVDFEALLPKICTFSTHDDAECHFVLESKKQCMAVLKFALADQYYDMLINELVTHQGLYLTCSSNGKVTNYSSFEQYLAERP